MTLVRTNPNGLRFQGLIDNLFSPEFDVMNRSGATAPGLRLPKLNIKEDENSYSLELAVPGMLKEDFKIELDQDVLSVSSEKKEKSDVDVKNYTRKEFSYHSFERKFTLPEDADGEKVAASYVNGVLSIEILKREETKPQPAKSIEIV